LEDLDDIPIALNAFFSSSEIQRLLKNEANTDFSALKNYPAKIRQASSLRKIMYYRTQHTLPANMLIKIDRMSMANSLEVRAPFLDPDLFDAAARLPDKFLIKNGKGKHIIRQIMEKELPKEVFNHPKSGFSIPLHKYQNKAFKNLAKRLLFEENPLPNLFNTSYLEEIYQVGVGERKSQKSIFQSSHHLWMMMQLLGWAKRFEIQI
jgi:asparagine synthase (glutamine-hydrolysing)